MRRSGAVSLLIVLALAAFPVAAWADSANDQYTEPLPDATGNNPGQTQDSVGVGGGSGGSGGSGGAPAPSAGGSGESGGVPGEAAGQGAGSGGADEAAGAGSGGVQPIGDDAAGPSITPGAETSATTDDGDSFPLLPVILAALAVIALSAGAALLYNRRQGPGTEASGPSVG
jgi:hypothetical protein